MSVHEKKATVMVYEGVGYKESVCPECHSEVKVVGRYEEYDGAQCKCYRCVECQLARFVIFTEE
jgi:hypothetical protein